MNINNNIHHWKRSFDILEPKTILRQKNYYQTIIRNISNDACVKYFSLEKIQENPGDSFNNFAARTWLNSWTSNICGLEHNKSRGQFFYTDRVFSHRITLTIREKSAFGFRSFDILCDKTWSVFVENDLVKILDWNGNYSLIHKENILRNMQKFRSKITILRLKKDCE